MNTLAEQLKLTPCPHCGAVGTLMRHGSLTGFDDANPPRKSSGRVAFSAAAATDGPDADTPSASGSPTTCGD